MGNSLIKKQEDREAILAAEAQRRAALIAVDTEILEKLFTKNYLHVHTNGMVHHKQTLINYVKEKQHYLTFERGPIDIQFFCRWRCGRINR